MSNKNKEVMGANNDIELAMLSSFIAALLDSIRKKAARN